MPDREPQAWETSAPAPFRVLEREHGSVEVWAHGSERFTVRGPERRCEVLGFRDARQMAHALAERLDS